jgi:hypothetical protein
MHPLLLEPLDKVNQLAQDWADRFAAKERARDLKERDKDSPERKALKVICLTRRIIALLAEHDPFCLKQCQEALTGPGTSSMENMR